MGVAHALRTIAHRGRSYKVKNIRMVSKTWPIQTSSGRINNLPQGSCEPNAIGDVEKDK
jgi:hypothetical protein